MLLSSSLRLLKEVVSQPKNMRNVQTHAIDLMALEKYRFHYVSECQLFANHTSENFYTS